MTRDKFDKALEDKLGKLEVSPSDDVWAKLSRSLADKQREEVFGKAAEEMPQVAPVPNIRRPQRRKGGWAYIAASAAVVALLLTVSYNLKTSIESDPVLTGTESHTLPADRVVVPDMESALAEDNVAASAKGSDAVTPRHGRILAAATPGETDELQTGMLVYGIPMVERRDIVEDNTKENGVETRSHVTDGGQDEVKSPTTRVMTQDIMDSLLRAGEKNRRTKSSRSAGSSRAPMSAGLYASNSTSFSESSRMSGSVALTTIPKEIEVLDPTTGNMIPQLVEQTSNMKHDYPITIGVSVGVPVADRVSVLSGVNYSYMRSKSTTESANSEVRSTQKLHYIGIPVSVKYDFLDTKRVTLYASAGGTVEKCVSGKIDTDHYSNGVLTKSEETTNRGKGLQTSVGATVGVELKLGDMLGIYLEPGVSYYFENSNQPSSYRTEHPTSFSARAGVRINLGK